MDICLRLFYRRAISFYNHLDHSVSNKYTPYISYRLHKGLRRKPIRVVGSYNEDHVVPLSHPYDDSHLPITGRHRTGEAALSETEKQGLAIPVYTKLRETDDRYTKLMFTLTILKSSVPAEKKDKIILEGVRLINDAIDAGVKLRTLLFSKEETLAQIKFPSIQNANVYKVLYKTLRIWSSLDTCPGIMGIFQKPTFEELSVVNEPMLPITVLGNNIQDHGIMGSIIRSAASVGCKCVLFSKGCTDIWKQDVIRSGAGAHFRIPVIADVEWANILNYIPLDATVFLINSQNEYMKTDCDTDEFDIYEDEDNTETIFHGEETQSIISDDSSDDDEPKNESHIEEVHGIIRDETYNDRSHLKRYRSDSIHARCYTDIKFPRKDIVICISDQTSCTDPRVIKLACEFGGAELTVPMENGIESIKPSLAFSVILYEIKRQLVEIYAT